MLGKQAKILTDRQVKMMLVYLASTRRPARNRCIFLLSIKSGLRAKEIAALRWSMVLTATGEVGNEIALESVAAKGDSGRRIPMNRQLREALVRLKDLDYGGHQEFVITSERSPRMLAQSIVNLFQRWYRDVGLVGCSSHSGRRTFITNLSRNITQVGGSLRDVQMLAGHKNLQTTQRYIEHDVESQRKVVDLI
jgi:integrase/recombinase XerD